MNDFLAGLFKYYDSILLTVTAISAFVIYRMTSIDGIKSSATIIKLQIKEIERNISYLKKQCIDQQYTINEANILNSNPVYEINLWDTHSSKIFKELSQDEYEMISEFYENASIIKRLQNDIKQLSLFAMQARSENYHNDIFNHVYMDTDDNTCNSNIKDTIQKFNNRSIPSYIPKHYGIFLFKYLNEYKPLDTTAFQKLEKLANKKKFLFF